MAAKLDRLGACTFCEQPVAKRLATRHVSACPKRPKGPASALHVVVEARYDPDYWLHVLISPSQPLARLDTLLRDTWLECCGHLSSFDVAEQRYATMPSARAWGPPTLSMADPIERVLQKGSRFLYKYDFGSTTELTGRCLGLVDGVPAQPAIQVVARNHPIPLACSCGAPALWIGHVRAWCDPCAKVDDPEYILRVVNSPRMGVCGYNG